MSELINNLYERSVNKITWIQTASGRAFYPLSPKTEDICIEDIAHHLAQINRFTGASRFPISVAFHSVLVAEQAMRIARETSSGDGKHILLCGRWGLLHDASEAYLSDVNSVLKHQDTFTGYRDAEHVLQSMIVKHFGLPAEEPAEVKRADLDCLRAEAAVVMSPLNPLKPGWDERELDSNIEIINMDWSTARHVFMAAFTRLFKEQNV